MKIYVAGKFEEKQAVRAAQARLIEMGYEITHDWTQEDAGTRTGEELDGYLKEAAMADYEGVFRADAVLLLNHDKAFGAMVETGLALGWGRMVYVVAPQVRDCIFYHLPVEMGIRCFPTLEKALAALDDDLNLEMDDVVPE